MEIYLEYLEYNKINFLFQVEIGEYGIYNWIKIQNKFKFCWKNLLIKFNFQSNFRFS